jgi:mercuric ion transport protein
MTSTNVPPVVEPILSQTHLKAGAIQALGWSGLVAGALASSCCILPLALVSLGIGGVWVGKLTALAPYQPAFLAAAALLIGMGLWRAYKKPVVCLPGSLCERPAATRTTKILLWIGALLGASAASFSLVVPYFL